MRLLLGDCLDKLKELDDNSIDSIVTDPPYGLSFMGKEWDKKKATQETKSQVVKGLGAGMKMTTLADNIEFEKWVTEWSMECMRVLKPGGYMLAFGGSRMYHRLASGVENAGFEVRDQMMWIYGSGFPKSMNIGHKLDEWEGWGTALKPAHEPIVMARKPLSEKTVADNVLEWGTGGINIDDSRVGTTTRTNGGKANKENNRIGDNGGYVNDVPSQEHDYGRFPANVIFDEEAGKILDEQSGTSKSTGGRIEKKTGWGEFGGSGQKEIIEGQPGFGDIGGASRFFYCPKTSKTDRNEGLEHLEDKLTQGMRANAGPALVGDDESGRTTAKNNHPTVKPTDLMLYLIRLVTPKGGTTLDPFMGSGSTGKAAVRGGFDFVGIEREDEYMEISQARIQYEQDNPYNEETGERIEVNKNSQKFW